MPRPDNLSTGVSPYHAERWDRERLVNYWCFASPWSSLCVVSVADAHNNIMTDLPPNL
ncbi:hypothetical protein TWF103_009312 [Orbilia oligospora]|nr:hypothetical protein TWF103_009312 [Orbilia oligospora]